MINLTVIYMTLSVFFLLLAVCDKNILWSSVWAFVVAVLMEDFLNTFVGGLQ